MHDVWIEHTINIKYVEGGSHLLVLGLKTSHDTLLFDTEIFRVFHFGIIFNGPVFFLATDKIITN